MSTVSAAFRIEAPSALKVHRQNVTVVYIEKSRRATGHDTINRSSRREVQYRTG
jgi:hypothetical protein